MRKIVPIVEGQSEAMSIPAFIRRILHDRQIFDVEPGRAVREHRHRLVKPEIFTGRVRMAQYLDESFAAIAILDADDDAACELGPRLLAILDNQGITIPVRVVLAVRELEVWLIAGVESLRGHRGIPENLSPPDNPESIRGAKEWLDRHITVGYKPATDQISLLMKFDYQDARTRSPSLDKFLRDLDSLIALR